ncbi:MAG: type II toxin-antitoxin system Y4mF family antitoxin [Bulleidia sp.]
MTELAEFVRENRKKAGLTQEQFAMRSGLGIRFIRDLEQGKTTLRMDKVNEALAMFDMKLVPGRRKHD